MINQQFSSQQFMIGISSAQFECGVEKIVLGIMIKRYILEIQLLCNYQEKLKMLYSTTKKRLSLLITSRKNVEISAAL